MFHLSSLSIDKEVAWMQEILITALLPPKVAESDPWVMACVDLVGTFTTKSPYKTY
jgi:hypothetical protein